MNAQFGIGTAGQHFLHPETFRKIKTYSIAKALLTAEIKLTNQAIWNCLVRCGLEENLNRGIVRGAKKITLEVPEKIYVGHIGADLSECRIKALNIINRFSLQWAFIATKPAENPPVNALTATIIRDFYLNCIISCLEEDAFRMVLNELNPDIINEKLFIASPTEKE